MTYQLLQRIGAGGCRDRARHRDSGEQVAVKVLRADASQCTAALDDFTHEIDMLKKLDVKGVPRYIAEGSSKGRPALVMELIQGHPIHNMIFENIMFDKVTALVEMIKIVAKVHSSGILHNDLKPENFMLAREGRVYLVDFGNAGFADTKVGLLGRFFKRRRSIFGTPTYMAPNWSRAVINLPYRCLRPSLRSLCAYRQSPDRRQWSNLKIAQSSEGKTQLSIRAHFETPP